MPALSSLLRLAPGLICDPLAGLAAKPPAARQPCLFGSHVLNHRSVF